MCPAGEDLVSEPQDEVEELQREGEHVHTTADGATDALEPVWTGGPNTLVSADQTHSHTLTGAQRKHWDEMTQRRREQTLDDKQMENISAENLETRGSFTVVI